MDREKIIEKLEKEVKRTYAIKTAMYECGKKGYEKISEEITEHREPFVTLTIEMADKILALLKEQEHKDRMFHELEEDWKRLKELLKEQEAVVRCKDCKHILPKGFCHKHSRKVTDDYFCADGEKKE